MIMDESFNDLPFEEKIKIIEGMTEEQIQQGLEQTKYICKDYCGKCPSYQGIGETDLAFCSIGKSVHIKNRKDCLCKQCPIFKMMSLRWEFYCIDGNAIEQAIAEKK